MSTQRTTSVRAAIRDLEAAAAKCDELTNHLLGAANVLRADPAAPEAAGPDLDAANALYQEIAVIKAHAGFLVEAACAKQHREALEARRRLAARRAKRHNNK